ncbi:MAG TPA: HD domain-containing protein [Anaerolineae bacterium]|nr:HD domain-containing protein [Anaerolineae bacterium]
MIDQGVWDEIRKGFALPLDGIHGQAHWLRVRDNGLRLSEQTGADPRLVELFAYLHDSKRLTDGRDPDHGRRAAEFVRSLAVVLSLSKLEVELLSYACAHHTQGLTEADVIVQTCWDADRLDLGRVGIRPNPRLLCTAAARDPATIEWAYDRSRRRTGTSNVDSSTHAGGSGGPGAGGT